MIDSYSFGSIVIGDQTYSSDIIISSHLLRQYFSVETVLSLIPLGTHNEIQ
jgi:hypothetical protein